MKVKRHGLTPRQQKFVNTYLLTLNASEAARAAGYKGDSADSIGAKLKSHGVVKHSIDKALSQIFASDLTTIKHKVLVELQKEAFESSSFIEDVNAHGGTVTKPNTSKLKALELLAKYLGMLTEKIEHSGEIKATVNLLFGNKPRQREEPKES